MSSDARDQDTKLTRANKHILPLRSLLVTMSEEDRLQVFSALEEGYCRFCGYVKEGICHCQNDE